MSKFIGTQRTGDTEYTISHRHTGPRGGMSDQMKYRIEFHTKKTFYLFFIPIFKFKKVVTKNTNNEFKTYSEAVNHATTQTKYWKNNDLVDVIFS